MKVYFDSIGCRLNQSEIENYANQFRAAGHEVIDNPGEADLVIVNTCSVTSAAESDSRQKIRQATRQGAKRVIATGCWATLAPQQALALDGVERVIPNEEKDRLFSEILLKNEGSAATPFIREPLPGTHRRTRAFIKVQDGCDHHCTYCITRLARGSSRSLPVDSVLEEIHSALAGGAKEIVLTGVNLGSWGKDFQSPQQISELILEILRNIGDVRVRLSSIEPWDIDDSFYELFKDTRMCRQLHFPLQSGSEDTLKRMARKTTPELFSTILEKARRMIPEVAVTTDIIAGFPGETDETFQESLQFIQSIQFAGGHAFPFSPRPGTPAANYPNQIDPAVKRERVHLLREVFATAGENYRQKFLGQTMKVLWESAQSISPGNWEVSGLTDNYIRVRALANQPMWNCISPVRLDQLEINGCFGTIIDQAR